jgi:RNA polymerase sigma-70 factor (ECF subfamily)
VTSLAAKTLLTLIAHAQLFNTPPVLHIQMATLTMNRTIIEGTVQIEQARFSTKMTIPDSQPEVAQERATIKAVLLGNVNAFQSLVEAHQTRVYNHALRMLGNEKEAEDATQDAFTQAFARLGSYNAEWRFKTWIMTIASNLCIDRLRRRKIEPMSFTDYAERGNSDQSDDREIDFESGDPTPDVVAAKKQQHAAVRSMLNELPAEDRSMVAMFYWDDMSYEDIAKSMNTTVSAVKSRLFRARQRMAQSAHSYRLSPIS